MEIIMSIFNNTISKKFNRKIGKFFCILSVVSSSLWTLSASAEEPLVFNNKASMDALWAELKTDISDLQPSSNSPLTVTTPKESHCVNAYSIDACKWYIGNESNSWGELLKLLGLVTVSSLPTYANNKNIEFFSQHFAKANAVSVTLD